MVRVCLIALVVACGATPAPRPPVRDSPPSPFELLAAEIDGPAQQPLWPTLPENIREDLERSAGAPADHLAAGRDRLAHWTLDFDEARSEASDARLRAGLEGLFLVEPIAFGTAGPAQLEAAGLLQHFYGQLDRPKLAEWIRTVPSLPVDRRLLELLDGAAHAMWQHFTSAVLRAGEPKDSVDGALHDLANRKASTDDHRKARELYELFLQRRGSAASADDWLDVANAEIRVDDAKAAGHSIEAAKAIPATGDRRLAAKLHGAERDHKDLTRYLVLADRKSLDAQLETLDLLRSLGRPVEAKLLLATLRKDFPRDARVHTRVAAIGFEDQMEATGNVLQGEAFVADELADRTFENQDGDYWSMLIGAQGVRAMADALPQLSQDFPAGARKMTEILETTRDLTRELAKTRPGRAAALTFVLERVISVLAPGKTQNQAALDALRTGFADALALRAKFPDTAEVDQLIYMLSMFYPDRQAAFAAVVQQPATPPDDDIELYLQRARAAVSLVVSLPQTATVAKTRELVEAIPPSWDPATEAAREAMLGDCDILDMMIAGGREALPHAAKHYELARTLHKSVAFRMANNLGWIAGATGDSARAAKLFAEASEQGSARAYIAQLNAITTTLSGPELLDALHKLAFANTDDGRPPIVLSAWLAATATDPAEAAAAAKDALNESGFYQLKPDGTSLGIDGEGVIEVGFGIASRKFFALNTKAYTNLWLTSPQPLTRGQLENLAKPRILINPKSPKPPKRR